MKTTSTYMNDKCINIMRKIGFSDEEINLAVDLSEKYSQNKEYQNAKSDLISEKKTFIETTETLKQISQKENSAQQQLYMLLLLENLDSIYIRYEDIGVSEDVIYDTLADIKVKVNECMRFEKLLGISRAAWFRFLYNAKVFKLGRFQYTFSDFGQQHYEKNGVVLKEGMTIIGLHIPQNNEKMDDEAREKSYKMAYYFFKKHYPEMLQNDYLPIRCSTWLFFEKNRDFLGENSTIVRFMNEFEIISKAEWDVFYSGIFLFGLECKENDDVEKYPQNTTLQKEYVKWMSAGNKTGAACGVKLLKY